MSEFLLGPIMDGIRRSAFYLGRRWVVSWLSTGNHEVMSEWMMCFDLGEGIKYALDLDWQWHSNVFTHQPEISQFKSDFQSGELAISWICLCDIKSSLILFYYIHSKT